MGNVVVLGSLNFDTIARVDAFPKPGTTIVARDLTFRLGGKGGNQAVAAARQGASVLMIGSLGDDSAGLVDISVKANFRSLGQRFGKQTPLVAGAISATDAAALVHALRTQGTVEITVADIGEVAITVDDVVITETPREGWAVVTEAGESVALDLTLDDELRRAGEARELVRSLQEGRKTTGLEVSDRIEVWWSSADHDLVTTWHEHGAMIAAEVLALQVHADGDVPDDAVSVSTELPVALAIRRAARGPGDGSG